MVFKKLFYNITKPLIEYTRGQIMKKSGLFLGAIIASIALMGCSSNNSEQYKVKKYTSISNPAAVYCVQQNGMLETVTENGMRVTYCVLSEGNKIEQWQYYRDHHQDKANQ